MRHQFISKLANFGIPCRSVLEIPSIYNHCEVLMLILYSIQEKIDHFFFEMINCLLFFHLILALLIFWLDCQLWLVLFIGKLLRCFYYSRVGMHLVIFSVTFSWNCSCSYVEDKGLLLRFYHLLLDQNITTVVWSF